MYTLKRFLSIALMPVGTTMYIWGGGWNDTDTGAGSDAKRLGLNPNWEKYFKSQTSDYDYTKHKYEYGNGLDCSGYLGWVMYNFLEPDNLNNGYVTKAKDQAKFFADMGLGKFIPSSEVRDYRPGDIMSAEEHVYIVIGQCKDGSVLFVHSSPPGVQVCGTATPDGTEASNATLCAKEYTVRHHPLWYRKFGYCKRGIGYLTDYSQFRWNIGYGTVMSDPDCLFCMPPRRILTSIKY